MELTSKIILVVGGASGIGRATVELCTALGAKVILADVDEKAGALVAQKTGAKFIRVDLADEASIIAMYRQIDATYSKLDVLLHCAGILLGAFIPLEEFSTDTFRKVIEINTTGCFLSAKYAFPLLKKAGKGVIILVSSGAATGGSSSFAYGSSKGGVHSLGIVLANSLAVDNIRVNVLAPGGIDTPLKRSVIAADVQRKGHPDEFEKAVVDSNLGTPEGVAKVLAWLASDDADYVRGVITTR